MTLPEEDDMALKILHTADWHLGREFPGFDAVDQQKLTRARLDAVERILGEAETYGVDAVLCAGDLFDSPTPETDWWKGLGELFAKRNWTDRPVFLLPGNHDPVTSTSVYSTSHAFRQMLPDWVHVIDRKPFEFELSADAVLYAAPCFSRSGHEDQALELPQREAGDDRIRIGMVHGQTFTMAGLQTNFPISKEAAAKRGLDYLALGDTHGYRNVTSDALAPTVYPGAPEATTFGESDAGYAALVYFRRSGAKPRVTQLPVGRWKWRDEECTRIEDLRSLQSESDLSTTVMRLTLKMAVSLSEFDEVETILKNLRGTEARLGQLGVILIDRAQLTQRPSGLEEFPDDMPEILKKVVARLSNNQDDPETARQAIYHLYRLIRS